MDLPTQPRKAVTAAWAERRLGGEAAGGSRAVVQLQLQVQAVQAVQAVQVVQAVQAVQVVRAQAVSEESVQLAQEGGAAGHAGAAQLPIIVQVDANNRDAIDDGTKTKLNHR